ncbi:MAG: hypothetical protein HY909_01650 [Deltaproteobacteria bacterium]|nr:hypothetical protein [Deltaproteobacteria bacterium]
MKHPLSLLSLSVGLFACTGSPSPTPDAATPDARSDLGGDVGDAPTPPRSRLSIERVERRIGTRDLMFASIEMQQSGEPLAEALGRDLAGYDRYMLPTDRYADPAQDGGSPEVDLLGFASAVESYEYSKNHMNMLAFESAAGFSFAHAPLHNPRGLSGEAAVGLLRDKVQRYAIATHAGVRSAPGGPPLGFVAVPPPTDNPLNILGFGGFWPTLHPFPGFDPSMRPSTASTRGCSLTSGYGASAGSSITVGDYECGYSTLHLLTRNDALSTDFSISPGASGWSGWKYALWVINYLQLFHDVDSNAVDRVPEAMLSVVGREGNTLVGTQAGGEDPGTAGTFLGSSDVEGFQAAFMIDQLDNQAWHWLSQLTTRDGTTLGGFGDLREALAYDYTSPLRWIPASIAVTETREPGGYPRPSRYMVRSSDSQLQDLLGLLGSYSELFAITDRNNTDVGGAQTARAWFDGDPFPADNLRPDGEDTLHDRALAMVKFTLVTLDRAHRDPASGLLADRVTFAAGAPSRGATLSTTSAAYTVVALRLARRSLGSQLTLYSNSTPDTAVLSTALDAAGLRGAPEGHTVAQRLTALLRAHADLLLNQLTTPQGDARRGYDLTTRAPTAGDGDLDAHTAALRGLLEAFLATGDARYRDRAEAVFQRLEALFWDPSARVYRSDRGADAPVLFTPVRFGLLQGSLREFLKLVAQRPGQLELAALVQSRLARINKLVLNGWDDRDGDDTVDWPEECALVEDNLPRGGLQMAERALTGETGLEGMTPTADRDHDCVPEIDDAFLPAALASELRFRVTRP